MTTVLASVFSALLVIIGIFVERKSPYFWPLAAVILILASSVGIFQVISAQETEGYQERLEQSVDTLAGSSVRMSGYLSNILLSQPQILRDFGVRQKRFDKQLAEFSTDDLVRLQILEANKARADLIEEHLPSQRKGVVVWYYTKEVDDPIIRQTLEEIGFVVENRVARANQANDLTNAIWYGPNTDLNDYKIVILNMIRAGIDILRTGPSCSNRELKNRVIEVGSSDEAAGKTGKPASPPITVDWVMQAEKITDLDLTKCRT